VEDARYVQPVVKMEFGARSDTWPAEAAIVKPFVAERLPQAFKVSECPLRVLAAERTFWEMTLLVHEETFRPLDKKPRKPRMARHYYDLWSLIRKGVAARAVDDMALFERVVEHREVFFHWAWVDYTTLRKGALRLMPPAEHLASWRQDYQAMRGAMFLGEPPLFDEVLAVVRQFEKEFNQS
jgi:hypothetical protein